MSKKNYDIDEVINSLENKGCSISRTHKTIIIPDDHTLGNRSWGKVGFLVKKGFNYRFREND